MGTETKFNCYTENNTSNGDGIIPKALNGSTSPAGVGVGVGVVGFGAIAGQTLHKNGYTNGLANGKQNGTTTPLSDALAERQPLFIPIHIDEHQVVEGAKEVLKVIRPHWDLNAVLFKSFTDGITNKLVGCFYNPDNANDAIISNGHSTNGNTNGNCNSTGNSHLIAPARNGSSAAYDDNNDSGNISDADTNDTNDSEITSTTNSSSASGSASSASIGASSSAASADNVMLVRVYGNKTDQLIDRKAEMRNILLLHSYGFAPTLHATFKNGLAYDYVPGVTLNTSSVLQPEVWRLVARRMAEMHRDVQVRNVGGFAGDGAVDCGHGHGHGHGHGAQQTPVPMLWKKMQKFFDIVPERFSDADKHKRLEGTFLPLSRMRDEFTALYRRLETLGSPVVFAHNDLLLGNIVLESQQRVSFIDYEYADYNFQAFDIGNHFCEFAGIDEVDYARYPTREFQLQWLRVYLQTYQQRAQIADAEVERLYVQVNQFALAAHFFWVIWSLIQAEHSTIDFDYVDYGLVRYQEYLDRKDSFLALEMNGRNNS